MCFNRIHRAGGVNHIWHSAALRKWSLSFTFSSFRFCLLVIRKRHSSLKKQTNKKKASKASVRHTDVFTRLVWGSHKMLLKLPISSVARSRHLTMVAHPWRKHAVHMKITAGVNLSNNTSLIGHVKRKTGGCNHSWHVCSLQQILLPRFCLKKVKVVVVF